MAVYARITEDDVTIRYVSTADNVADLLTKPLGLPIWSKLAPQLRGEVPLAAEELIQQYYQGKVKQLRGEVPLAAAELIQQYYQDYDEVKDG